MTQTEIRKEKGKTIHSLNPFQQSEYFDGMYSDYNSLMPLIEQVNVMQNVYPYKSICIDITYNIVTYNDGKYKSYEYDEDVELIDSLQNAVIWLFNGAENV